MAKCLRCGREQEYIICKACAGDAGNFINKNIKPVVATLGSVALAIGAAVISNTLNINQKK